MLQEMLIESQILDNMPLPEKQITLRLAKAFEDKYELLFSNPEELADETEIGTKEQWQNFLKLIPVEQYIKGQMAFISQISQRKTFKGLVEMALAGNAQAAKQVQELSGIMNQQDTNRTIILHRIPRPKQEETKQ